MKRSLFLCLMLPAIAFPQVPMGDANCDGSVNVGDAVKVIDYVFRGGQSPCEMYLPSITVNEVMLMPGTFYSPRVWGNIVQLTVNVPCSGVVHLFGRSTVQISNNAPVRLGFDTTASGGSISYPDDSNPFQWLYQSEGLDEVVEVAEGQYTFYLNLFNGAENAAYCTFHQTKIIATFYPDPPNTGK